MIEIVGRPNRVPVLDRIRAGQFVLRSRLWPSDELRVTPLSFRRVPKTYANRKKLAELRSDPNLGIADQIGLLAVNRQVFMKQVQEHPDARMGIARAVGKAMVFGAFPSYRVREIVEDPDPKDQFTFAIRMDLAEMIQVAPGLQLPDKSVWTVPSDEFHATSPVDMDNVSRRLLVVS